MTVKMIHLDTGKTADVHPVEVDNWRQFGWRIDARDANSEAISAVESPHMEQTVPIEATTETRAGTRRVGKGPRGLWFVYLDDERISPGFQTEKEAREEMTEGDE